MKLIGIDLNNFGLGSLPNISTEQIRQIATLLGVDPLTAGVQPIAMANDYQNPKSIQYGIGVERELSRALTVGADFSYVHTAYLQQNRDLTYASILSLRPILRRGRCTGDCGLNKRSSLHLAREPNLPAGSVCGRSQYGVK